MGAADDWNAIAARLASLSPEERWKSADVGLLYGLAVESAPGLVGHMGIDRARAHDLAGDLVIAQLHALVEAQIPFPYFVKALKNAVRTWLRRPGSSVSDEREARVGDHHRVPVHAALELEVVLARLTPDEREIFAALSAGETPENIAERFKKSVGALYKQISRARQRLKDEGYT